MASPEQQAGPGAYLVVLPDKPRFGDSIVIQGKKFLPSAAVQLKVSEAGVSIALQTNPGGNFDTTGVLTWAPARVGVFTIEATDGTNSAKTTIQVWT